ncbi:hypothetical protein HN873_057238 [Arachis hypogaea]
MLETGATYPPNKICYIYYHLLRDIQTSLSTPVRKPRKLKIYKLAVLEDSSLLYLVTNKTNANANSSLLDNVYLDLLPFPLVEELLQR